MSGCSRIIINCATERDPTPHCCISDLARSRFVGAGWLEGHSQCRYLQVIGHKNLLRGTIVQAYVEADSVAGSFRRVDGRCVASVSVSLGLAVANRQGCVAGSSRIDKQLRVCSAIGETQRKTKNPARLCELHYFTSSAARGGRRGDPRRLPRTDVGGSARVGVCGFRLPINHEWNSREAVRFLFKSGDEQ